MISDQQGLVKVIRILILVTVIIVAIGMMFVLYQIIKIKRSGNTTPTVESVITNESY